MKIGLGLLLAVGILGAGGAQAAAAPQIQWEVVNRFRLLDTPEAFDAYVRDHGNLLERAKGPSLVRFQYPSPTGEVYRTAWQPAAGRYRDGYFHPASWTVRLSVAAPPQARCEWNVDGKVLAATACQGVDHAFGDRDHDVRVRIGGSDQVARAVVHPTDLLVVSLGDSFASGEGVPDVNLANALPGEHRSGNPAQWWDRRCHRSLFAGPALAAVKLAQAKGMERRSVTFASFACSGAEVAPGLLDGWEGREVYRQAQILLAQHQLGVEDMVKELKPPQRTVLAQVDALARALCPPGGATADGGCSQPIRKPDVIVLSVGGNDVGFGPLIVDLAARKCDDECLAGIRAQTAEKLEKLTRGYDDLARAIADRIGPGVVLLTEYPDPTRDASGQFCEDSVKRGHSFLPAFATAAGYRLTRRELSFAYETVAKPLQQAMAAAAARPGWRYVGGLMKESETKGYCSSASWFNTYSAANAKQGELPRVSYPGYAKPLGGFSTGAMHPNIFGNEAYARHISEAALAWMREAR